MQTSKDRVALIPGANKAIGFEIARQGGNRILIGSRNPRVISTLGLLQHQFA